MSICLCIVAALLVLATRHYNLLSQLSTVKPPSNTSATSHMPMIYMIEASEE
jgi:hypothetical protein